MSKPEPGEIVEEALKSGRIADGRTRLDDWQASQEMTLDALSKLRYYRPLLGQVPEAIDAAKQMVRLRAPDASELMADYLSLGRLQLAANEPELAWEALCVVMEWSEFQDYYAVGMARSAVELALDISAGTSQESELCERAYEAALASIADGCSTSFCLLEKARDNSHRMGRTKEYEQFKAAAAEERSRIDRQLAGQ